MADQMPAGNRVKDYNPDDPITHTQLNNIQTEVIHAVEARRWNHTGAFLLDNAGSWVEAYTGTGNYGYYLATAASPNGEQMGAKINLPVDATIIDIDVIYKGSNRTGGEIALYEQQLIAVGNAATRIAPAHLFDLGDNAANPWQPAVNPSNVHRVRTTVNTLIAPGYEYYVSVISSTTGGGSAEAFFTLLINAQFSTG